MDSLFHVVVGSSILRNITTALAGALLSLAAAGSYGGDTSGPGAPDGTGQREVPPGSGDWTRLLDRQALLDEGIDLPDQWGVAAFYSSTESRLPIANLKYKFTEDQPLVSNPVVSMDDLDNSITNSGIILDYWVLPMLDLYAILGQSDGEMDSVVRIPGNSQPLGFNFTGTSYALGATIVMAYEQAILMLDYNYMELDTDVYEKIIPVSNTTVRAGWNFGRRKLLPNSAWLSYIITDFEGTFDLKQTVGDGVDPGLVPPGSDAVFLSFEVEKYDTWAIGAQWDITEHLVLVSELGFDVVEGITFALNYRW